MLAALSEKGEGGRADYFSGNVFQETGMRRILPGCLRKGIQTCGFAALGLGASKLFLLEICGSLCTYWIWKARKGDCGPRSLPSQSSHGKMLQSRAGFGAPRNS